MYVMRQKLLHIVISSLLLTAAQAGEARGASNLDVNPFWSSFSIEEGQQETSSLRFEDAITQHLLSAISHLEKNTPAGLSAGQLSMRHSLLNKLRAYAVNQAFPQNTYLNYKNPVFIDSYGNHCAVGYMMQASGNEMLAQQIAANYNLNYISQIPASLTEKWAADHGFEAKELALIQPGYIQVYESLNSPGAGLPGTVNDLYLTNGYQGLLYAAGNFNYQEDDFSTGPILNIGAFNFSTGLWEPLDDGLNGEVQVLFQSSSNGLIAGGTFNASGQITLGNIASWNGSSWSAMGSLNGMVTSLAEYNGEIYAAGAFSHFSVGNSFQNIAKWDAVNQIWVSTGISFNDTVFTLEVIDSILYIGGKFTHNGIANANFICGFNGTNPLPLSGGVSGPVHAIVKFNEQIYAGGSFIYNSQYFALKSYNFLSDTWTEVIDPQTFSYNYNVQSYTINSLKTISNGQGPGQLLVGGNFIHAPQMNMYQACKNFIRMTGPGYFMGENSLNAPVNDIEVIDNGYFVAGDFTVDGNGDVANHIGFTLPTYTSVEDAQETEVAVYPNPASEQVSVQISNGVEIKEIALISTEGKTIPVSWTAAGAYVSFSAANIPAGIYIARFLTNTNEYFQQKLVIK